MLDSVPCGEEADLIRPGLSLEEDVKLAVHGLKYILGCLDLVYVRINILEAGI